MGLSRTHVRRVSGLDIRRLRMYACGIGLPAYEVRVIPRIDAGWETMLRPWEEVAGENGSAISNRVRRVGEGT